MSPVSKTAVFTAAPAPGTRACAGTHFGSMSPPPLHGQPEPPPPRSDSGFSWR
jgi:hypothetical protein